MAATGGPLGAAETAALFAAFEGRGGVVLAVSGGADSTALLLLAARWRAGGGATPLTVATVDHGLRSEAADECAAVARLAQAHGLPCTVLTWRGGKPTSRIQEAAREARYALLSEAAIAAGCDAIATAHTLDDQAETVLMRLARGSGVGGLAAMRPQAWRGDVAHLRPLLGVTRRRLVATLEAAGQGWIEDPSNADPRYERVRIRALLPALAASGLTRERLALLAARAARADDALDAAARQALAAAALAEGGLHLGRLAQHPQEVRLRAVALALAAAGPRVAYPLRLERLETLGAELDRALAEGRPLRRSLGGFLLALAKDGRLSIRAEAPRRRGRTVLTPVP